MDPEGQPLTFSWTQVEGPVVSLFVLPITSRVLFQAPPITGMGARSLFFRLTVSDGVHQSHDWVQVRVFPSANIAPIARYDARASSIVISLIFLASGPCMRVV